MPPSLEYGGQRQLSRLAQLRRDCLILRFLRPERLAAARLAGSGVAHVLDFLHGF
jgi:hypothetical protein